MQKRIQKEIGNNCLKRIIVAFLAVIMMTTMLHPQMVQAATGITIESKDNKVLTYKAGEKKTWTFTVTNHSGNPMNNVTVTPDLGDDNDVWPFKTEMQSYQQNIGTLENGKSKDVAFDFTQREDVQTSRYTLKFKVTADGQEEAEKQFYVIPQQSRYRKTHRIIKTTKIQMTARIQEKAMEQAVVLTHLTRHRMPAVTVTEKQLTAEEPVEVRMEVQLREMVLFRV